MDAEQTQVNLLVVRTYLAEWARELGLTDLLRRAFDDAGLP